MRSAKPRSGARVAAQPIVPLLSSQASNLHLSGQHVSAWTADGDTYSGVLRGIDGSMNLHLEQAELQCADGRKQRFGSLFLRGSSVVLMELSSPTAGH